MIQISQLKMPLSHTTQDIAKKISNMLKIPVCEASTFEIVRKSLDARKKSDLKWVYTIRLTHTKEAKIMKQVRDKNIMSTKRKYYEFSPTGDKPLTHPPVVVGSGPAGLFCTYMLALHGYQPILIERGEPIEQRTKTVEDYWNGKPLNTESNVQFGEGGAGTFSDGKLNTQVNDKYCRDEKVIKTFIEFGAPQDIAYDNHPHIGTDILQKVIIKMRQKMLELGATIHFNTKWIDYSVSDGKLESITVTSTKEPAKQWTIPAEVVVMALGHSARDTFEMLHKKSMPMQAKSFAVGVRVEHPQEMIQTAMYGTEYKKQVASLPAAPYKLTARTANGRNVYSFCMCPGGYVVNASSEEGRIAVNGMSYSKRDGNNANSAIIVSVTPEDFPDDSPLSGMHFQRELEEAAYQCGKGNIPVQLYADFKEQRISEQFGDITPCIKGNTTFAEFHQILPNEVCQALEDGMEQFGTKIAGFNRPDAVFSGVESRTSSPIRIPRDENFLCHIEGMYPCGEGAGYAGGITSAAMDGIKVFEAIAKKYMTSTKK